MGSRFKVQNSGQRERRGERTLKGQIINGGYPLEQLQWEFGGGATGIEQVMWVRMRPLVGVGSNQS